MRHGRLALTLLWRDGRSGELTLLLLALLIAVASTTAISLFADRLQRTMVLQAAEFMAGDMALSAPVPIDRSWQDKAGSLGLQQSHTTEFASVLLENGEMLLASVKAVSVDYPLRGALKIAGSDAEQQVIDHGPAVGELWVEPQVLSTLHLKLGDELTVGRQALKLTQILHHEPDKRGDFYSLSPRVMMHQQDLAATAVIQPGSRVQHLYQFAGETTAINSFRNWLQPQLNPSQKIRDIHNDRPELGSALQRAERYLGLSSIVVMVIAGTAIAMATRRYSERHFNATALLRCLGCKQADIVRLYGYQFLWLGLSGSALGCGLGWLAQMGLFQLLQPLLPQGLAAPSVLALVLGMLTGLAILWGFALPPLLRLQKVSPLRVLRRDLAPLPSSGWLVYGLALLLVGGLIWRFTGDSKLAGQVLGVGMAVLLVLGGMLYGLLRLARRLLPRLGLHWRFALQALLRQPQASIGQILAFSLTLSAMALSFTVRNDLLANWRQQLPEQAPNHFAINILPELQTAFADDLQQAQIASSRFYPIVRGRLVAINQEPVQGRVSKDSQGEEATQRELSLTWAAQLPEDNIITAGQVWQPDRPGLVSVEQKLADNLKINLGDQLTFTVGSAQMTAQVVNLRSVRWDSMRPNFYMIFSPGTLEGFPATYLTSFYLSEAQKPLLTGLLKKYPATTVLAVDQLLKQFNQILQQLSRAIDLLLCFALAAGFTVLFAAVYSTLDQRISEGALLRSLGARRRFLRITQMLEFCVLGGLAGLLAVVTHQAIVWGLYQRILHIDFQPDFGLWAILPGLGAVLVGAAGIFGTRAVVSQSPLQILRR